MLIIIFQPNLYGQNYLSKEKEKKIKLSEKYYWGEGSDFKVDIAKQNAFEDLINQINQSKKSDETLKAIEMNAHFDQILQQGKVKILAWIAKDSVFVTIKNPILQTTEIKATNPVPDIQPEITEKSQPEAIKSDNPVIEELVNCKTYKQVMRTIKPHGWVVGRNSSKGFAYPEKCIIAVFTQDDELIALLEEGNDFRTDLISGKTIQNPEQYYKSQGSYNLLWIQIK
jgi:hypothetical protein